jgi:predicted DCC family thiol-disulfide oxidoreductase YuxK
VRAEAHPTARAPTITKQPTIVLFDGVCNLCSGVVRFLIARDPHARFRFAALQSQAARKACKAAGYELPAYATPSTIVVIEHGRALERSDAVLAIARRMRFPWPVLGVFRVLPRGLRDVLYRFVARNRYRWFGRADACMAPTAELRKRVLD